MTINTKCMLQENIIYGTIVKVQILLLVCSRHPVAPTSTWGKRGRGSVFKAHSPGHPLKRGGT